MKFPQIPDARRPRHYCQLMHDFSSSVAVYHTARNGKTEELLSQLHTWHQRMNRTQSKRPFLTHLLATYQQRGIRSYEEIRTHVIHALRPGHEPEQVLELLTRPVQKL